MKKSNTLRLKINHIDYEVRPLKRDFTEDSYGWHIPKDQAIYIDAEQPASEQARILCHELIHAWWWAYNLPKAPCDEEKVCEILESPLVALFRDNPHLSQVMADAFAGRPLVK